MDETDGVPVDVTERVETTVTLPGDDITVIPDAPEPANRRRVAWIVGAVAAVVVLIGAIALVATRDDDADPVVATDTTPTTAAVKQKKVAAGAVAKPKKKADTPTPTTVAAQQPVDVPKSTPVPASVPAQPVVVPPTAVAATVPPTTVPAAPVSVVKWTAPKSVTLKTGASTVVDLTAHNPSKGIVSLPRPLSCAPTLDNSEMCPQVIEKLQPGSTAGAHWTVSAVGIKPGTYTLNFAGLMQIPVTVTA